MATTIVIMVPALAQTAPSERSSDAGNATSISPSDASHGLLASDSESPNAMPPNSANALVVLARVLRSPPGSTSVPNQPPSAIQANSCRSSQIAR